MTTPPRGAEAGAWKGFRPQFSDYDVVLSNYNGETWPEHVPHSVMRSSSSTAAA